MSQVRPQDRLRYRRKRNPHPNRHGRLVVTVRQLQRRLVGPRLAVLVQGVADLHIVIRVQGRNLHVAVRALEVIAVQVKLPLNTPTLGGAFIRVRRPKSGADVVRTRLETVSSKYMRRAIHQTSRKGGGALLGPSVLLLEYLL